MPPVPRVNSPSGRNFPATLPPGRAPLNHSGVATRVATNQRYTLGLGAASAGTFTLSTTSGPFQGVTAAINFNDTAAVVQTRLEAIVGAGNVTVTGGPLPGVVTITFTGELGGDTVTLTGAFGGLTGATPALTLTQAAANVSGAYAGGRLPGAEVGRR